MKRIVYIPILFIPLLALSYLSYSNVQYWRDSISLWKQGINQDPDNDYAHYSLGLAYMTNENDYDKALYYLNKAIEIKENHQYYNNRGRVHFALGNIYQALDDFEKAINFDSTSFAAYNNRGAVLINICRYQDAKAYLRKAIELKPDYQEAKNNLRIAENLIYLNNIVTLNNDFTYYNRDELLDFVIKSAQKLTSVNEFSKAEYYLDKGFEIAPNSVLIYAEYGILYYWQEKYDDAINILTEGLKIYPNNSDLMVGRGMSYIEKGNFVKACNDFTNAADLGNNDAKNLVREYCN